MLGDRYDGAAMLHAANGAPDEYAAQSGAQLTTNTSKQHNHRSHRVRIRIIISLLVFPLRRYAALSMVRSRTIGLNRQISPSS
jgi:hypothetical protein